MLFLHELPYQAGLSGFEKTEAPTRFIVPNNACIEPLLFMYIAKVHVMDICTLSLSFFNEYEQSGC